MNIKESTCKTALSPSKLPGLDYSLNPYRGCEHNCAYCYAPSILRIVRNEWGNFIFVKKNIPLVLSKELKKKKKGVVGISTVTDPYQPIEKKYQLTRYCLEQLLEYDFPISVQTKSSLVEKDIELISRFSNNEVIITISTLNDKERKLIEPNSSPIKNRLKILKKFAESGIPSSVFFGPIYPTISKDEIPKIIDTFIENGAYKIWIDPLRLKIGVWSEIKKNIIQNEKIFKIFSKNLFENKKYYKELREEIISTTKKKNIKIIDAF
jgi:DNA repair photolyase